jgi:hypothetical protein
VTSAPEAASSVFGDHPNVRWPVQTPADDLTLLHDLDLPRVRVMAATPRRSIDLLALNAGDGNKDVLVIDHRADSVVTREWHARMKLRTV